MIHYFSLLVSIFHHFHYFSFVSSIATHCEVDIMSHDTFEAKILKPCFVSEVMLREEPAKNALSSFPQTTRWMVGEVRNASYPPGLFRVGIICAQRLYGLFNLNAPRPPFLRQHDIPVAWGTDYIAHISFRVMHAGAPRLRRLADSRL